MEGSIQRVGIFLYIESYIICHNNLAGMRKKRPNLQKVLGVWKKLRMRGKREDCEKNSFNSLSHSENGLDLNKEFSEFKGVLN